MMATGKKGRTSIWYVRTLSMTNMAARTLNETADNTSTATASEVNRPTVSTIFANPQAREAKPVFSQF